jgi:hypothetical protein
MSELEVENKALTEKVKTLELRVKELEEKNASYVDRQNKAQRKYVEANPEITKERKLAYHYKLKETDPERLKAYRHQAYLNRKARLQAQHDEQKTEQHQ